MPPKDKNQSYLYAFEQIPDDARIAFCQGDVDLDDINFVDLSDTGRFRLEQELTRWGRARGIEE